MKLEEVATTAMMDVLRQLRTKLDRAFSHDTAFPGTPWPGLTRSAGHCAAVSVIVRATLGGEHVSATVNGVSHWFNRIAGYDVDLTGDQFGFPEIQMKRAGHLYVGSRERLPSEVNEETITRASVLAVRAEEAIP